MGRDGGRRAALEARGARVTEWFVDDAERPSAPRGVRLLPSGLTTLAGGPPGGVCGCATGPRPPVSSLEIQCRSPHQCSSGTSCRPSLVAYWLLPRGWRNGLVAVVSLLFYTWGAGPYVFLLLSGDRGQLRGRHRHRQPTAGRSARARRAVLLTAVIWDLGILAIWKYAGFASRQSTRSPARSASATPPIIALALPDRHLVLHLPPHLLRGRRPPAQPAGAAEPAPVRHLHRDVPAADRRPDRALPRDRRPARRRPAQPAGRLRPRLPAVRAGPGQEGGDRRHDRAGRRRGVRHLRRRHDHGDRLGRRARLHACSSTSTSPATPTWRSASAGCSASASRRTSTARTRRSSITDFWRRWHMSLSRWFRDYVYIPLGGNRHGAAQTYRNLLIIFVAHRLLARRELDVPGLGALPRRAAARRAATGLGAVAATGPALVLRRASPSCSWSSAGCSSAPRASARRSTMLRAMFVPTGFGLPEAVAVVADRPAQPGARRWRCSSSCCPGRFVLGRVLDPAAAGRAVVARLAVIAVAAPCAAVLVAAGTFSPFLYYQF